MLLVVGTAALGLSFFNNAFRISLSSLREHAPLAARLLLVALPLTFLLGTLLAAVLIPNLAWVEAALVAIILTPADTGLITTILSSARVPVRIRQAINIESSLNDGLTTPIAAILIAMAQTRLGYEVTSIRLLAPLQQIVIAVVIGALVGGIGGWLMRHAVQKQWIVPSFEGLVFPSLTILALSLAAYLSGNYFIACFVGGSALGFFTRDISQEHSEFSETLTHLLSLVVFLFLGSKMVEEWQRISWQVILYALLSLTAVRMVPIAIALWGKGLQRSSKLFLGWFGPRGLASIVLAIVVVDNLADIPHGSVIVTIVITTVFLSIVLHGVSAIPLLVWYGRQMESVGPDSPENQPVAEIPYRFRWSPVAADADRRVTNWEAQRSSKSDSDKT